MPMEMLQEDSMRELCTLMASTNKLCKQKDLPAYYLIELVSKLKMNDI